MWNRIKISLEDPEANYELLAIKACNETLDRLIKAARGAQAFRTRQGVQQAHLAYEVRAQSQSLSTALNGQCHCSVYHEPKLRTRPLIQSDDPSWDVWFNVLLLQPNHACCEMSIGLLSKVQNSSSPKVCITVDSGSKVPGKTVLWNTSDQSKWVMLQRICEAVEKAERGTNHLHVAIDPAQKLWEIEALRAQSTNVPTELIDLEECLTRLQSHARKRWLYREKAILSAVLAHSLLQLHESPWLSSQWGAKDISFVDTEPGAAPGAWAVSGFKLSRPYLSCSGTGPLPRLYSSGQHRNPCLLALGLILLELYLNRSLSADLAAVSPRDVRPTLGDTLEECYENDDMSEDYYHAIRFCLWPNPDPQSRSYAFEDSGFRERYYNEVVLRLEAHLESKVVDFDEKFWDSL